ncbi:hypothetical protein HAT2_00097 [Candidatus Similichlamydia laticola]|uniref:Uncharacterized protein n=1 Tax=Candidatus Similichlamydia laticola TaxID=2170265 RepID=A0A369KFN5_9BACT|nr:hypothetical protein HAT2_00097 [Candidatus Similichlamydia laticola]
MRKSDLRVERELVREYVEALLVLAFNPLCLPPYSPDVLHAFCVDFVLSIGSKRTFVGFSEEVFFEVQLTLRIPGRSKPLQVTQPQEFIDAVKYQEVATFNGRQVLLSKECFTEDSWKILNVSSEHLVMLADTKPSGESSKRAVVKKAFLGIEAIAHILCEQRSLLLEKLPVSSSCEEREFPLLFTFGMEAPLRFAVDPIEVVLELDAIQSPSPKLILKILLALNQTMRVKLQDVCLLLKSSPPGLLFNGVYYAFRNEVMSAHLRRIERLDNLVIPEPLCGTFLEYVLPEMRKLLRIDNEELIQQFSTYVYTGDVRGICHVFYVGGKLEVQFSFLYGDLEVPEAVSRLTVEIIRQFVSDEGILARNLVQERALVNDIFHHFVFDPETNLFLAKNERALLYFMTEVIPKYRDRIEFRCPDNLLDQFIYDATTFKVGLYEGIVPGQYEAHIEVNGHLAGLSLERLWECVLYERRYVDLISSDRRSAGKKIKRVLVLDLKRLMEIIHFFDDLGIKKLETGVFQVPFWTLAQVNPKEKLNELIDLTIDEKLLAFQREMSDFPLSETAVIPQDIKAVFRTYQEEGIVWLERLRKMHLNGILADDMGLGKTLQGIVALTHFKELNPGAVSLVVCPTSLLYNWQEEIQKFSPNLSSYVVDGAPITRKKIIESCQGQIDVLITSYTLLQKDVESYKKTVFGYVVLDEAQHIKNRSTRNAKAVKLVKSHHRLVLTGTPVENNVQELWSLFDFLMPGFLSNYERFVDKYVKGTLFQDDSEERMERLKRKVSPFILRRLKKDVVQDLPPVNEIVYHCALTDSQKELYCSYARSAKEELTTLISKEGFESVQINVLATLTRLKQICCHPAIFSKDNSLKCDSAKYQMFLELVDSLVASQHKAVVFSQYTKMLQIMKEDLEKRDVVFSYLDGSSKNRMETVHQFNENPDISLFLVSLKAGGTGLNLVGADSVIHYDMWWNPALEEQATSRVHRTGQSKNVSCYKLVTLGTIEEKIIEMQERKRNLAEQVITNEEDVMTKLTWEEVLELLET